MPTIIQVKGLENPEKTRAIILAELRRDFEEWLSAKEDGFLRPAIELTERDDYFRVQADVARIDPRSIEVLVARDMMLIKAAPRRYARPAGEIVHRNEFAHGKLSRAVQFPRRIDLANVRAEVKDGLLTVKAQIAKAGSIEHDLLKAA